MTRPTPRRADPIDPGRLRLLNNTFGLGDLAQVVLFIALAEDVRFDVSATFASGPPGEPVTPDRLDVLFSYPLAPAAADGQPGERTFEIGSFSRLRTRLCWHPRTGHVFDTTP